MRKVFVLLIALVLFLPTLPAAAATSHAAPRLTLPSLSALSFAMLEAPAVIAPERVPMVADENCTPFICSVKPLMATPELDGRRLHRVRTYTHILWSPGVMDWGSVTAATQRTRAVQTAPI
jgi:hypothetical protein